MVGPNKKKSGASIRKAQSAKGNTTIGAGGGYGGHFRAVQGFRYYGQVPRKCWMRLTLKSIQQRTRSKPKVPLVTSYTGFTLLGVYPR
jgi:hypothetical protein